MSLDRPGDDALWRSVADTLDRIVLPAIRPGFEQDSARQLLGLARYAMNRRTGSDGPVDPGLAVALGRPAGEPAAELLGRAADLLVRARQPHVEQVDAEQVGSVRAILLDRLAADIAEAAPLMETFSGHTPAEEEPDAVAVPEEPLLRAWLADRVALPIDELEISVMVGGHSRRMLSVGLTSGGVRQDLVVRIEQGGMFGTEGDTEARVMRALADAGFATAAVRWIEPDPSVLGQPFFVMDRVPGSASAGPEMIDLYVTRLDDLHHLDPTLAQDGLGPVPATPRLAISALIDHWLGIYRQSTSVRHPLLEDAAEWLRVNLRPTGPVCIVHGDPGPGNFLHDGTAITALTDWELTHYGDPAEDWTYFGAIRARKIHDAATWRARFAELAGVTFSDSEWMAWEAFNHFKGACVNLTALRLFSAGVSTTPNLLAIGTAVHLRFVRWLTDLIDQLQLDAVESEI